MCQIRTGHDPQCGHGGDGPLHTLHHTLVSGAEKSAQFRKGPRHKGDVNMMITGALKILKTAKCIRRCSKNTPCLERERLPQSIKPPIDP